MIPLPSKPKIVSEEGNRTVFEIEGLYPGFGQTIGNSMRRVLLSSLKGAAITSVKIEGVGHEFTVMEGVMEDVVDIILNLKQMRFRLHEDGPFTVALSAKGEREVRGKDFEVPSQVEVMTDDLHIATLTSKKANFKLEVVVESGLGYMPVEAQKKEKTEVGTIALDAAFSPVRHVNYEVEHMRVGNRTDYNRVRFHVETDGSISARDAFTEAAAILVEQFGALKEGFHEEEEKTEEAYAETKDAVFSVEGKEKAEEGEENLAAKTKLDELKFSARTLNILREAGIKTVSGLLRKREESLREMEGMGDKGIQEIRKALGNFGITLRQ